MENKFFAVTAKCGHVGKQFYYEGTFYIRANNKSEAAAITRNKPRVKHDHKDAILWVEEITSEEYDAGRERFEAEAYFHCGNKRQHNLYSDEITAKLRTETDSTHERRRKMHFEKPEFELRNKKPYKRERLNLREEELNQVIA